MHFFASAVFVSKPCQFTCMYPHVLFRGCSCSCVAVTLVLEWGVGFVRVFVMVRLSQWVVVDSSALYIPVAHCSSEHWRNGVFHLVCRTGEQWCVVREPMCYERLVFAIGHVHARATCWLSRDTVFLHTDHLCFVDFETYCSSFVGTVSELPSRVLWSGTIWC